MLAPGRQAQPGCGAMACRRRCISRARSLATVCSTPRERLGGGDGDAGAASRRHRGSRGRRAARSATGSLRTARAPRRSTRSGRLIARPTLNLVARTASLAQAAQVFQVGSARAIPRRATSVMPECRCRRSTTPPRGGRSQRAGVEVCLRRGVTAILPANGGFRVEVSGAPTLDADAVILAVAQRPRRAPDAAGGRRRREPRSRGSAARRSSTSTSCYDRRVLDSRSPPASTRRCSGCSTAPRAPASADGAVPCDVAVGGRTGADDDDRGSPRAATCRRSRSCCLPMRGASVEAFFVTREHAATFRAAPGARALRPGAADRAAGLRARRELDGHGLAGDDGGRGAQRPGGGA